FAAPEPGTERDGGAAARLALRVVARAAAHRIDLGEHLLGDERLRVHEPDAVGTALEPPQIAVAARVHEALDEASVLFEIDEQRRRDFVPVPGIVPVVLMVTADPAGTGIEGEDRRRVEVVAGMHVTGPRRRVARPPERQVELRIVVRREPHRDAARLPRFALPALATPLARSRARMGLPHRLAAARVSGGDVAANPELAARGADHDLALGAERS